MAIATYTKSGTKATTAVKLDKTVFGVVPENHELMKAAYVAYLANGRQNSAVTKKRGEVSGGGRKPWKQKGTGRARFGSIRNPIWRGGGIAFGPTGEENYTKKLHVTAKRQAIRHSLSVKADASAVIVLEDFVVKENKTTEAAKLLQKVNATGKVLIIVDNKTDELVRSVRNLQNVKLIQALYVNVYDVINADQIIVTNDSLKTISEWLGGEK